MMTGRKFAWKGHMDGEYKNKTTLLNGVLFINLSECISVIACQFHGRYGRHVLH